MADGIIPAVPLPRLEGEPSRLSFAWGLYGVLFLMCFKMATDLLDNFHIFLAKNRFFWSLKISTPKIILAIALARFERRLSGLPFAYSPYGVLNQNRNWFSREFSIQKFIVSKSIFALSYHFIWDFLLIIISDLGTFLWISYGTHQCCKTEILKWYWTVIEKVLFCNKWYFCKRYIQILLRNFSWQFYLTLRVFARS